MATATPPPAQPTIHRRPRGCLLPLVLGVLFLSLLLNLILALTFSGAIESPLATDDMLLTERFFLGDRNANDKIAVVRVPGVISESGIRYPVKQLELAAKDRRVKAVVLRIDSPGGTVSASEELYQCIVNVRDNNGRRFPGSGPKPVSVSMGALATSGGYYVAVAGRPISAEQTTITGSIGVFAALPNVAEWSKTHGVKLELVKAGSMKASGSFFHAMSPEERQTWQDTVDSAYDRFLTVIAENRRGLTTDELRDSIVIDRMVPKRDEKGNPVLDATGREEQVKYQRRRADGGTFTARDARAFDLVDDIEDLPATIRRTASANALASFKAVIYDRTPSFLERMTGLSMAGNRPLPDLTGLATILTPRLWYLAPSAEGGIIPIDQ